MVKKNHNAAVIAAIAFAAVATLHAAKAFTGTPQDSTTESTATITTNVRQPVQVSESTVPIDFTVPDTIPPTILYDVPLDIMLQLHIIQVAESYGLDPAILFAMCFRESSYNPASIGDHGASYGLMQIQPRWHSDRMERLGCLDLLDPFQNVMVGADYLAEQRARYGGDIGKALVAYNAGHYNGTITRYAQEVLAKAEELRGTTYEADGSYTTPESRNETCQKNN